MTADPLFDFSHCRLCPRECGVDRTAGQLGFCREGAGLRAARAALLYCEEPCISGTQGSGAVFFTGCNLGCVFCQNAEITGGSGPFDTGLRHNSEEEPVKGDCLAERPGRTQDPRRAPGAPITPERLCDIFFELEQKGAANIHLVTAAHFLPLVLPALEAARQRGLSIPIVYNTSAYEKPEAIRRLDGLVDIYLPDLKFRKEKLGRLYAAAPDYWERATAAIDEMVRQCPLPLFADGSCELGESDADIPLMKRGVIVRHLVLPGQTGDSRAVLKYLHGRYGGRIFISILNQYTPMPRCAGDPLLSRPVTEEEYDAVVDYALRLGVENGFIQEGGTVSRSFIPSWDGTGITAHPQRESQPDRQ